jgi:hypothetical protein
MRLFLILLTLTTLVNAQDPDLQYLDIENYFHGSFDHKNQDWHNRNLQEISKLKQQENSTFLEAYESKFDNQKGKVIFLKASNKIDLCITNTKNKKISLTDISFFDSELVSIFWKENPNGKGKLLIVLTKTKNSHYTYIIGKSKNIIDIEGDKELKESDWILFKADELNGVKNFEEFNIKWSNISKEKQQITFKYVEGNLEHYPIEEKVTKDFIENVVYHNYGGGFFRWQESAILEMETKHHTIYSCLASNTQGIPDRILFSIPNGNGIEIQTFLLEYHLFSKHKLQLLDVSYLNDQWKTINLKYSMNGKIFNRKFLINCGASGYCSIINGSDF